MKKLMLLVKIFYLILGVTSALLYGKIVEIIHAPRTVNKEVIFQIPNGASLNRISEILYENDLIEKSIYFILYSKLNKIYPQIKAGEYLVKDDISLEHLANLLTSGKVFYRKITFPEGITAEQAANLLYDNEYLTADFDNISDGSILPETYTFSRGTSRNTIVIEARKALDNVLDKAWNEKEADLPLKSKHEMLILASIVEKETGVAAERPKIASVFINRLRKGMMLQTDPTIIYAITKGREELKRPLTRKDLEIDSPYNTYKNVGLPPTPICNPGRDAIMAVAHPYKTPYLYFVASGNGGHNFARSLSEHNENVRKWRQLK